VHITRTRVGMFVIFEQRVWCHLVIKYQLSRWCFNPHSVTSITGRHVWPKDIRFCASDQFFLPFFLFPLFQHLPLHIFKAVM
jgi:hypothetical protein